MKTVLIVKTSSLGDVIHTLPALTDAVNALGNIQFDWVVEESFSDIPGWHPAVRNIIPVAIRRWRKNLLKTIMSGEWKRFKQRIQLEHYDYVIDAQGLLKSALITRLAQGESYGLDKYSAREGLSSRFYQHPQNIERQQHAVERVRQLFAKTLGYQLKGLNVDYGISEYLDKQAKVQPSSKKQILFLHGTTWDTKHWPEVYWFELANEMTQKGYEIVIPWGNDREHQRACVIKEQCQQTDQVTILDKMGLNELVQHINNVDAVVAVDTGLAHLSAALDKPTVALYGPTSPGLTGTYGQHQQHLQVTFDCAPCFKKQCDKKSADIAPECFTTLTPTNVMSALEQLFSRDVK